MEALRAVFAKLGFEIDTKKVDDATKRFNDLIKRVGVTAVAMASVRTAASFMNEQIQKGSEIKVLADQFAMTTDEVQKYKFAAEQVGLTTHQMVTAFKILANHMGASTTMTGMSHAIKQFGQYGISVKDSEGKMKGMPQMLGDIAEKMQTFGNAAQRVRFANEMMGEMGFRLIPLLMQGREGVTALFKDFDKLHLAMSEKFVNAAMITGQKLKMLKQAFQVWKSEMAQGLFPVLQMMAGKLARVSSWLTDLARKTTWATTAWIAFAAYLVVAMYKIAGGLKGLWLLFSRFMVPVAIFGILYLIFDDFFALLTGKESLIGGLLDKMYGAGKAAEFARDLKAAWGDVSKALTEMLPNMKELGNLFLQIIPLAVKSTVGVLKGLIDIIQTVKSVLDDLFDFNDIRMSADAVYERAISDGKTKAQATADKDAYIMKERYKKSHPFEKIEGGNRVLSAGARNIEQYQQGAGPRRQGHQMGGDRTVQIKIEGNADKAAIEEAKTNAREWFADDSLDAASQGALYGGM